jgi:hypothetical protein
MGNGQFHQSYLFCSLETCIEDSLMCGPVGLPVWASFIFQIGQSLIVQTFWCIFTAISASLSLSSLSAGSCSSGFGACHHHDCASLRAAMLCDNGLRRPLGLYEHTIHQNDANLTYNMAKYRSLTENVAERDLTISTLNRIAWHKAKSSMRKTTFEAKMRPHLQ